MVLQLTEQNNYFGICSMNSESRNLLEITLFESSSTDVSQENPQGLVTVNKPQILELVRFLIKAKS